MGKNKQNDSAVKKALEKSLLHQELVKPELLYLSKPNDTKRFLELTAAPKRARVVDFFIDVLRELYAIQFPERYSKADFQKKFEAHLTGMKRKAPLWCCGCWAYFPWKNVVVHILEEKDFQEVRTARNKLLITKKEQQMFYNATVVTAGLSIGNSVITSVVVQGGAKNIRLADFDYLSLSNLNRIRRGVDNLGINKCVMTAREIYEINPFAEVEIFSMGLNEKNIDRFLQNANIIIDEVDDFPMKILLREKAKKRKIAVISGIDNAESVVIDIERYDSEKNVKIFNNRIGQVKYEQFLQMSRSQVGEAITRLVGYENISERMKKSLSVIGKEIVTWPQLGSTALLNGAAVSYFARQIINKESMPSGRIIISLDKAYFLSQRAGAKTK